MQRTRSALPRRNTGLSSFDGKRRLVLDAPTPHAEGPDMNAGAAENVSITLDLTGPGSHSLSREPGMGSFALGPGDTDVRRLDAIVPLDAAINWAAFDGLTVPAGYSWPRAFYYHGDDVGF